jgi:hypothetical protein
LQLTNTFSLNANDYIEMAFAVTGTALFINSTAATAYAPASPGVLLSVTQTQL